MNILRRMNIPGVIQVHAEALSVDALNFIVGKKMDTQLTLNAVTVLEQEQFNGQWTEQYISIVLAGYLRQMLARNTTPRPDPNLLSNAKNLFVSYYTAKIPEIVNSLDPNTYNVVMTNANQADEELYYFSECLKMPNQQPQYQQPQYQQPQYQQPQRQPSYFQQPTQNNHHQSPASNMSAFKSGTLGQQQQQPFNGGFSGNGASIGSKYAKRNNINQQQQMQHNQYQQPGGYQSTQYQHPQNTHQKAQEAYQKQQNTYQEQQNQYQAMIVEQSVKESFDMSPPTASADTWKASSKQPYKLLVTGDDTLTYTTNGLEVIMEIEVAEKDNAVSASAMFARFNQGTKSRTVEEDNTKVHKELEDLNDTVKQIKKAKDTNTILTSPADLNSEFVYKTVLSTTSMEEAIIKMAKQAQTEDRSLMRGSVIVNLPIYGKYDVKYMDAVATAINAEALSEVINTGLNSDEVSTVNLANIINNDLTAKVNRFLSVNLGTAYDIDSFAGDLLDLKNVLLEDAVLSVNFQALVAELVISHMSVFSESYNSKLLNKEREETGNKDLEAVYYPEVHTITYVDKTVNELGIESLAKAPMSKADVKEPVQVTDWYLPHLHSLLHSNHAHAESYRDKSISKFGTCQDVYLVTKDMTILRSSKSIATDDSKKEFFIA